MILSLPIRERRGPFYLCRNYLTSLSKRCSAVFSVQVLHSVLLNLLLSNGFFGILLQMELFSFQILPLNFLLRVCENAADLCYDNTFSCNSAKLVYQVL